MSALAIGRLRGARLVRVVRVVSAVFGACLLALACSGCIVGSPPSLVSTAYFSDVGNLTPGAPVEMAGISIGSVQAITLSGTRAKVSLSIERSADVPCNVSAQAEQSTVLGQEVVDLVTPQPKSNASAVADSTCGLLADHSVIRSTSLVPGIEQFVSGGTAVLGSIGTSQLASLIDAGGEGFGGQAAELKQLIGDLNTITAGYASRDGEIRTLVSSMGSLSASLAPHAAQNAQALTNLSKTVAVLDSQSENFVSLLKGLDNLSIEGHSLLTQQLQEINFQFQGLAGVTSTLDGQQSALAELLEQLPGHNMALHDVTVNRFAQVIDSIIICGLPDGGGNTSQAASSCHGAGGSTTGSTP